MPVALRPAHEEDFAYCRRLYFAETKWIIEALHLDPAAHEISFRQQWEPVEVRIMTLDGADIGWLQTSTQNGELFIAQMFVDRPFQSRGFGTEVMEGLIGEATRANQAVRLNVVKINPAVRLYERLGFEVTHEDERKFYMRHDPNLPTRHSG